MRWKGASLRDRGKKKLGTVHAHGCACFPVIRPVFADDGHFMSMLFGLDRAASGVGIALAIAAANGSKTHTKYYGV